MKKIIILLCIVLLITVPLVTAIWWNPFSWKWVNDLLNPEVESYDLCKNRTVTTITKTPIYNNVSVKVYCNDKNVSENCIGKYPNGTWYKYRSFVNLTMNIKETHKISCDNTGVVMVDDRVLALKDNYCKANQCGYKAVCYGESHGRGEFGEGCLLSGEEGFYVESMDDIINKYPFKYRTEEVAINKIKLNKK